jgi:hypothetical protein
MENASAEPGIVGKVQHFPTSVVGGFVAGTAQMVTGDLDLVGDALQLADASKRAAAGKAVKTMVKHPGTVVTAVKAQLHQGGGNKGHAVGEVLSWFGPTAIGKAVGAASKTANVAAQVVSVGSTYERAKQLAAKGSSTGSEGTGDARACGPLPRPGR